MTAFKMPVGKVVSGARLRRALGHDIAYLGWQGNDNLGDDAMFEALAHALLPRKTKPVPARGVRPRSARIAARFPGRPPKALMLGGGTLVGRLGWLRRWRALTEAFPAADRFTIGIGVEDPEFKHASFLTSIDELRAWAPALREMSQASARGPRSADILASVGVEIPVVGDPALLLADKVPAVERDDRVGINIGRHEAWGEGTSTSTPIWGDQDSVDEAVFALVHHLQTLGRRCVVFPMDSRDITLPAEPGIEVFDRSRGVEGLLLEVSRCSTVIGQRLHSVVIAHACNVPALALEYRPKVSDYLGSVGMSEWAIRTDGISPSSLIERWEALEAQTTQIRAHLEREVTRLCTRLRASCEAMVPSKA